MQQPDARGPAQPRYEASRSHPLAFGPFRLDPANARLVRDGRPVALTPKAFDVLHFIASRPDRLVTKDELLAAVWPDVIVGDASIKVCIREIRQALGDDAKTPAYIETVHRRGYRFVGMVCDSDVELPPPVAPAPAPVVLRPVSAAPPPPPPRPALVGREMEMRRLRELFDRAAVTSQRQVVFVTGGPGAGKTALVEAFLGVLACAIGPDGVAPVVMSGHCFEQFGTSEPYLPVWEALGRVTRERPSPALHALLARHVAATDAGAAGAATPRSASPDQPARHASEPRSMSDRVLREMADAIESLATEAPVVVVLEDVQWADYSTLDLISALARRRSPARLTIIATYRPAEVLADEHPLREVAQELLSGRLCRELVLDAFDEHAVEAYLAVRFPGAGLPAAFAERLHKRTNGNPLFLVHVVNDLVDQGVIRQDERGIWRVAGADVDGIDTSAAWLAVLDTQVPQTVRAMIELQLDRLDERERATIEAAAVAGIEFCAGDIAALTGGAAQVVRAEETCEDLARRRHLFETHGLAEWPDGTIATNYRFAHELYHNVVYERISAARRAMSHRTLGLAMETAWGPRAVEEAAELAMHFEQGRDWPRAVRYLRGAADSAGRQYAHREAVVYLRRALAATERLAPDARAEHELAVLTVLGVNLQVTRGFAAPEVREIHARADALSRAADTPGGEQAAGAKAESRFPVLWGIWLYHKVRSDLRQAVEMADRVLEVARSSGDPALLLQAHQAMCVTHLCVGAPAVTIEHMRQAHAIYDPTRHADNTRLYGQDPGVATLAFGAVAHGFIGDEADAMDASRKSVELARRLGQPSSLALALHFAGMLHQCRDEPDAADRAVAESTAIAEEEEFSFWLAGGTILRGWAGAARGDPAGIDRIHEGLDAWIATGSRTYHTYYLGLLADALQRLGRIADSIPVLAEAVSAARSYPEGIYEPELLRLQGRAALASGPDGAGDAERHLREGLAIAQRQRARWFEHRIAADMAEALRRLGDARGADAVMRDEQRAGAPAPSGGAPRRRKPATKP